MQKPSKTTTATSQAIQSDNIPGTRANLNYLDQLTKFHKQHGTSLTRFPSVDKRPLDLYKLKKAVEIRGGFEKVCKLKKWAEIGRDLGYSGKIMSSLSTSLKNSYQRWLQPYEEYLRVAKPGVQHQLEIEHGGPFTPSANQSPADPKRQDNSRRSSEVNGQAHTLKAASNALNASISDSTSSTRGDSTVSGEATPAPPVSGGFTAVNFKPANFTSVNAPSSFVAVNSAATAVKQEADAGTETPNTGTTPSSPNNPKEVPDRKHENHTATPLTNGHDDHSLKRVLSTGSTPDGFHIENGDAEDLNGRRSKRLKKGTSQSFKQLVGELATVLSNTYTLYSILDGVPTVAGSSMNSLRPAGAQSKGKTGNRKTGEVLYQKITHYDEYMAANFS